MLKATAILGRSEESAELLHLACSAGYVLMTPPCAALLHRLQYCHSMAMKRQQQTHPHMCWNGMKSEHAAYLDPQRWRP